jgi:hypothetical protein
MRRNKRGRSLLAILLGLLLPGVPAAAQQGPLSLPQSPTLPRYQANYSASLNSAASTVTVQATTSSGSVNFEEGDVYCSVACTATISVNGTAATATSLTVTGPIGVAAAVPPVAFRTSNVSGGTTLKTFNIAAGGTLVLDLTAFYLPAMAGGGANLTIATSSITGTATIQIQMVVQPCCQ